MLMQKQRVSESVSENIPLFQYCFLVICAKVNSTDSE